MPDRPEEFRTPFFACLTSALGGENYGFEQRRISLRLEARQKPCACCTLSHVLKLGKVEPEGHLKRSPQGWRALGLLARLRFTHALRRQMAPMHFLRGTRPRAIMACGSSDDVLFELTDGRAAIVHLTWVRETVPEWPRAQVYESVDLALEELDEPRGCGVCGACWFTSVAGEDCPICNRRAEVPCPMCAGRCGETWKLAPIDSAEDDTPVYIGSCSST